MHGMPTVFVECRKAYINIRIGKRRKRNAKHGRTHHPPWNRAVYSDFLDTNFGCGGLGATVNRGPQSPKWFLMLEF